MPDLNAGTQNVQDSKGKEDGNKIDHQNPHREIEMHTKPHLL